MNFRRHYRFLAACWATVLLGSAALQAEETTPPLARAMDAYAQGDYALAARNFETALATNPPSVGLYYNLALAQRKDGQVARAALSLRRALLLDPANVDVRMELSDLERSQGIPITPPSWTSRLAENLPLLPILIAGFALFWVGAFWLLWLALCRSRSIAAPVCGILACLLGSVVFLAAYLSDPRFNLRSSSVAMEASQLLAAPAARSETLARLPGGSLVRVLNTSGTWAYCETIDGHRGWMPQEKLTALVPEA